MNADEFKLNLENANLDRDSEVTQWLSDLNEDIINCNVNLSSGNTVEISSDTLPDNVPPSQVEAILNCKGFSLIYVEVTDTYILSW